MFSKLRRVLYRNLQKHFLSTDIQARAFDGFYSELLKSSYPQQSHIIQGHNLPCYNLLSRDERERIKDYLQSREGSFIDYGCGLSFISEFLGDKSQMTGIDFSHFALSYNREKFSQYDFQAAHLNLTPLIEPNSHILMNDSLYHFQRPLAEIYKLLKKKPQSLYWVHNFKEPIQSLEIKGHDVQIQDFTQDFSNLVKSWLDYLDTDHVQEERKIYPLIWDTLEKEMHGHKLALAENRIQRLHIKIERKN